MTKYSTKQRRTLLDFLAAHPDEQFTVKQIVEKLDAEGISASAVYRNLSDLAGENRLKRVVREGTREVCYQYTDTDCCRGHLHLICKQCGRTVHIGEGDTALLERIAEENSFLLDVQDTFLYGVCKSCGEEGGEGEKK